MPAFGSKQIREQLQFFLVFWTELDIMENFPTVSLNTLTINLVTTNECIDVALREGIKASPLPRYCYLTKSKPVFTFSVSFFLCLLFYDRCMNLRISACLKVVLCSVYLCLLYLSLIKGSFIEQHRKPHTWKE